MRLPAFEESLRKREEKGIEEGKFDVALNMIHKKNMSVEEAISFFGSSENSTAKRIAQKLQPLVDVGLSYVSLGQSSSSLSGGESQRIKLASFLSKDFESKGSIVFIFDEPTTGLHFHDIKKLLAAFSALIERGHTIVIIEHNMDVIKCADYIIDMGPEGGRGGGNVLFQGTPEEMVRKCKKGYTVPFVKEELNNK